MSSRGVIDLRPRQGGRKPPAGQQPLFSARPSRAPKETKKPLPLRARRRRVRAAIALAVLLVCVGIAWGISYASYLPQFSVGEITVVGAQDVSPQLVQGYVETILEDGSHHFLSRQNIFLYPRAVIERDVVAFFPRISSATISRASLFSRDLTVSVSERQAFALWCDGSAQCYEMDKGGFVFAQSAATSSSTEYVFQGGIATSSSPIGQSFVTAHLPGIVALLTELGQSGFTPQGASVESDEDFSVPLREGFALKASFGESADTLVKNLQLVLSSDALQGKEQELEYVDLRFGDRVYYKLQGQAEASSTPQ
jgi:cell division septal protein FtsQ